MVINIGVVKFFSQDKAFCFITSFFRRCAKAHPTTNNNGIPTPSKISS